MTSSSTSILTNSNNPIMTASKKANLKTPPIWMMRQAGRYHTHYQKLRAQHSFMELCKNPDLASEVALGPVQDFDFDVSILFSDLLFPLEAVGMGLEYTDHGPRLGFQLTPQTIKQLKPWSDSIQGLMFQQEAMKLTRQKIPAHKSVIGFVGGLWTLFVYAVEGSHAGSLFQSKSQPDLLQEFMQLMQPLIRENIQLQLDGGADAVMILDTAAGELSPQLFQRWIEPSLIQFAQDFPGKIGYYSKGTQPNHFSSHFLKQNWAGMGFDHRYHLPEILKQGSTPGFVQGNFDQSLLFLSHSDFKKELAKYLSPFKELSHTERAGWVCGLGHGILPKTPEQNVRTFVEMVRKDF